MREFKALENSEIKKPQSENFKQIKPETKIGVEDAKSFLKDIMKLEHADVTADKISEKVGTPEGIKSIMENNPQKADLFEKWINAIKTLDNPELSPIEVKSVQAQINNFKGQILELATKDVLKEAGFDVESHQKVVSGEKGDTKPDVVAVNNNEKPIEVFGKTIQSGEKISVECKCNNTKTLTEQLKTHIPNQLSGQEGTRVLVATSDINGVSDGLAKSVCEIYDAKLAALDVSSSDVEKAIKEVSKE